MRFAVLDAGRAHGKMLSKGSGCPGISNGTGELGQFYDRIATALGLHSP